MRVGRNGGEARRDKAQDSRLGGGRSGDWRLETLDQKNKGEVSRLEQGRTTGYEGDVQQRYTQPSSGFLAVAIEGECMYCDAYASRDLANGWPASAKEPVDR